MKPVEWCSWREFRDLGPELLALFYSKREATSKASPGRQYRALRSHLPKLRGFGGCCGTDYRHIAAICEALGNSGTGKTHVSTAGRT